MIAEASLATAQVAAKRLGHDVLPVPVRAVLLEHAAELLVPSVQLAPGALHVWATNVDTLHARRADALADEELARAQQIARPRARRRWMAARVFLRTLLGAYTGERPRSLRLAPDANGKPMLVDAPGLRFNLSHSGPHAVCALTRTCAVGVDVQVAPRKLHTGAIAQRAFGAHEAERLDALAPARRMCEFVRAWSAFEAERKRVGVGIARPDERPSGPQPWLCQLEPSLLDLPSNAACAVALALAPVEMDFFLTIGLF